MDKNERKALKKANTIRPQREIKFQMHRGFLQVTLSELDGRQQVTWGCFCCGIAAGKEVLPGEDFANHSHYAQRVLRSKGCAHKFDGDPRRVANEDDRRKQA